MGLDALAADCATIADPERLPSPVHYLADCFGALWSGLPQIAAADIAIAQFFSPAHVSRRRDRVVAARIHTTRMHCWDEENNHSLLEPVEERGEARGALNNRGRLLRFSCCGLNTGCYQDLFAFMDANTTIIFLQARRFCASGGIRSGKYCIYLHGSNFSSVRRD